MENRYQKWVSLSYLAAAGLLGYIVFSILGTIVASYDIEARIRYIEVILRVVSVAVGAILFFVLYRNQRVNQFMNEVMGELARVTWPSTRDTSSATMIVIVMVVISGIVLGFLDYFWVQLLKWIL
jgi:preprotein translocase subunit SecE